MESHTHCQTILESLSAYLDAELTDAVCTQVEAHLEQCNNCRVVVDTLRKTVMLYRNLPQPGLPGTVREHLYKTLDLTDLLPSSDNTASTLD